MYNSNMENDKNVLTKVIGEKNSEEIRSDGEVIAEECTKCMESFYPEPRKEISDEDASKRKNNFNYKFANFITKRPGLTMVSAVYVFVLAVAGVALFVLNNETVMAGTDLYDSGGVTTLSSIIWALVGVISFLFLLAIVYGMAVLSRNRNESK